jgi:hypothetical protein
MVRASDDDPDQMTGLFLRLSRKKHTHAGKKMTLVPVPRKKTLRGREARATLHIFQLRRFRKRCPIRQSTWIFSPAYAGRSIATPREGCDPFCLEWL